MLYFVKLSRLSLCLLLLLLLLLWASCKWPALTPVNFEVANQNSVLGVVNRPPFLLSLFAYPWFFFFLSCRIDFIPAETSNSSFFLSSVILPRFVSFLLRLLFKLYNIDPNRFFNSSASLQPKYQVSIFLN